MFASVGMRKKAMKILLTKHFILLLMMSDKALPRSNIKIGIKEEMVMFELN